jgi:hypothetical protein
MLFCKLHKSFAPNDGGKSEEEDQQNLIGFEQKENKVISTYG